MGRNHPSSSAGLSTGRGLCPVCGGPLPDSDLRLVPGENIAVRGGQAIRLTRREFQIFNRLNQSRFRIVHKADIMEAVYGSEGEEPDWKILDQFLHRLRKKLVKLGLVIEVVRNEGFALKFSLLPHNL
jgi:DNA-binding response OmpR family regulator